MKANGKDANGFKTDRVYIEIIIIAAALMAHNYLNHV